MDVTKLLANLNGIKDITVTPTQEENTNTFPITVKTEYTTYKITSDGSIEEVQIADRTGIHVGDYINYTPDVPANATHSKDRLIKYSGDSDNVSDARYFLAFLFCV